MVKLDAQIMRYMSKDEFRVLTAVEMGQKNHELVPTSLICRIAGLKGGGAFKIITLLHKNKLIFHESKPYDGYRLTYQGYDYLALRTFVSRGVISGIGNKIGVGKESDIYEVFNEQGESMVLKIHRLGRVSFRTIKEKRDYLVGRKNASWLYMSRLASIREFAYMKALHEHGFTTPTPIDHNRHCVVMSLIPAVLLEQVKVIKHPARLYTNLMNIIVRLADHGLIHCDFNEFNLLMDSEENITIIDFPQMVSTTHRNAEMYFDRDVQCIRTFFRKRFKFEGAEFPTLDKDISRSLDLDIELKASGCSKKEEEEFHQLIEAKNDGLLPDEGSLRSDLDENEAEGDLSSEDCAGTDEPSDDGNNEEENPHLDLDAAEEMLAKRRPPSSSSSSSVSAAASTSTPIITSSSTATTTATIHLKEAQQKAQGEEVGEEEEEEEEEEGGEGDEEEPESERRRRLKMSGPKQSEVSAEVKERVKRVVAGRQIRSKKVGSEAKRNTQKVGRNKTKRFIKNELRDTAIGDRGL